MKKLSVILITLLVAVPATWLTTRAYYANKAADHAHSTAAKAERKVLYYQSAMHPWIKSDKPGRCTICGMELTPVYEGDRGFDQTGGDVVPLTQSMIQVLNVQTVQAK